MPRFAMRRRLGAALASLSLTAGLSGVAAAMRFSDHGDTPLLQLAGRNDARMTDLYAFTRGGNLVLVVCVDPAIPADVQEYRFASDLRVEIHLDNDSAVSFADPNDTATFGGTVIEPDRILEDVTFRLTFDDSGSPRLQTFGLIPAERDDVRLFAGLRDDPFIRGPRTGRNSAAIVVELPLTAVLDDQSTLLIWASSKVDDLDGPFQDMAGRALRSQFPENTLMNAMHPRHHARRMGTNPDVMIFDTSWPALFPNGRALADDVVDLVGDPRVLSNDDPFPDANDVPFLDEFPYLAPPHAPGN